MKFQIFGPLVLAFALASAAAAKQEAPPSDAVITDQVMIKLAGDQLVKGGALKVDVVNGVVTISGQVDEAKGKDRAGKLAKKVKGVKQVVNKITVK
jgi:hyperosmotically inducible periplasmic protein